MNYHRGLYLGLLALAMFFAYKFLNPRHGKETDAHRRMQ